MKTGFLPKFVLAVLLASLTLFASIGRITALSGDVSIIRAAKTQKATPNFQLDEKDTIKSSAGATAQIMFNDKTVITVGSNTLFKVEEYAFGEKDAKARFSVGEGTFKSITGKIAKIAPEKFKVETKTATIGIRGTIFVGNVNNAGVLTVACTKGVITVTPNIPSAPPVIVNQGQMTKADNKGVEAPKAYTPADMKNLEKSLTTDKKAQSGSSGGGTQQASAPTTDAETPKIASTTPLVNKEAIPASIANNINTVLNTATTQKATETVAEVIKKEEDKIVIAPPPPPPTIPTTPDIPSGGGEVAITAAYIGAMPKTLYSQLPTTGMYMYKSLNDSSYNNGAGYVNFATNKVFHSSLSYENGLLFSEFGVGSSGSEEVSPYESRVTISNFGYEAGALYSTYEVGGFRGGGAYFGKFNDGTKDTYIIGAPTTSNIATIYGSGYNFDAGGSYLVTGKMVGWSMAKTDFNAVGLANGSSLTPADLSLGWDAFGYSSHTMSILPAGTSVGNNTLVSEDAFGLEFTNGGSTTGHMFTIADGGSGALVNDYASWGYWQTEYDNSGTPSVKFGFWVGGTLTTVAQMLDLNTAVGTATYIGKVLGATISPTYAVDVINTATSSVNLSVHFGALYPITGNIAFSTMGGQTWDLVVNNTVSSVTTATSSFSASFSAGSSTTSVGALSSGSATGYFYGPNAKSMGGAFDAVTSTGHTAQGVFKATR